MRLNLGCSDNHMPGWTNVDIAPPADQIADLALPWPWEDSSADEIYAADIFEHLPDRIHTMNEAYRVLKPSGTLTMECPDAARGAGQWQDPTHVSAWTPNGLQYFCSEMTPPLKAWQRFHVAYGITANFRLMSCSEFRYMEAAGSVMCEVWKFKAVLEAIKP